MQRFLVRLGERVTISPLVALTTLAIVYAAVTRDLTTGEVVAGVLLQVVAVLLGVRIHRPRSTDTGEKS